MRVALCTLHLTMASSTSQHRSIERKRYVCTLIFLPVSVRSVCPSRVVCRCSFESVTFGKLPEWMLFPLQPNDANTRAYTMCICKGHPVLCVLVFAYDHWTMQRKLKERKLLVFLRLENVVYERIRNCITTLYMLQLNEILSFSCIVGMYSMKR